MKKDVMLFPPTIAESIRNYKKNKSLLEKISLLHSAVKKLYLLKSEDKKNAFKLCLMRIQASYTFFMLIANYCQSRHSNQFPITLTLLINNRLMELLYFEEIRTHVCPKYLSRLIVFLNKNGLINSENFKFIKDY